MAETDTPIVTVPATLHLLSPELEDAANLFLSKLAELEKLLADVDE